MMKLQLQTKLKQNNTKQHTTTGFTRRALLLLTFIVAFVGSVLGQSDIPTKYKILSYNPDNPGATFCTPRLIQYWQEIANDCQVNMVTARSNLYVRWYYEDENGNELLKTFTYTPDYVSPYKSPDYESINERGYYKNGGFDQFVEMTENTNNYYDPRFGFPADYDINKIRLVCLATTKTEDYSTNGGWKEDPKEIQVKYVFTLKPTSELGNWPFVHYQGVAGLEYDTIDDTPAPGNNYTWDASTGTYQAETRNIRQRVHTWEYNIYANLNEERELTLPFQNFEANAGVDKEPEGYIRWYDWKTDAMVSSTLYDFTPINLDPKAVNLEAYPYGHIAKCLPRQQYPYRGNVGVKFKYTNQDEMNPVDIACDVSKYADGMDDSYTYLIHEPTLSNRYIFHIRPASELAGRLDNAKTLLETAKATNNATTFFNAMAKLEEERGKVVVSLGENMTGNFSLRFDQQSYNGYYLTHNNTVQKAEHLQWYAYYEDSNGKIWEKAISGQTRNRIETFSYNTFTSDFSDGTTTNQSVNAKKFHVVGYAGVNGYNAPVVHYELQFMEAPPILVSELLGSNLSERTDAYMKEHYNLAAVLDFDGNVETNQKVAGHEAEYFSTKNWYDAPTSSIDNMTYVPFPKDDIQYGFCYPMLTYSVRLGAFDLFASPAHGDYIILKSMNMPKVSITNKRTYKEDLSQNVPYGYYWWNDTELHDYTYYATKEQKHGSFLYTDASDESRTIARIPFTANLCSGSSFYFTAAVADMTKGEIKPQLLIRIVGIQEENGERVRKNIVAFHTGNMNNDVGVSAGKWYQVYGKFMLPASNEINNITEFEAEIVNYADGTAGADFAIDQIAIYTSTSKVLLSNEISEDCDDADKKGKVRVFMDDENLQNMFSENEGEFKIYWRICREKDGKVVTGAGMYPRPDEGGADDGTRTYGITKVNLKYDEDSLPTEAPDDTGWYLEDGTVYFQFANQIFPALEEGVTYYVSVYHDPGNEFKETNDYAWGGEHFGAADVCSIYSEFFFPRRQYVAYYKVEGKEGGDLSADCGTDAVVSGVHMVLKMPDDNEPTGFKNIETPVINFDYAFYPMSKWNSEDKLGDDTDYTYVDLRDAWLYYRGANSNYNGNKYKEPGLAEGYQHTNSDGIDYRKVLEYAIEKGLLELANSTTFEHDFAETGEQEIICVPTVPSIEIDNQTITLCAPFKIVLSVTSSNAPELELGFMEVTYPEEYTRVIRVGLEQLANMQKDNGYLLHIPVHMFRTEKTAGPNTGALTIISDYLELLKDYQTNDATVTEKVNIATFAEKEINGTDKMFISVNLHGTGINKLTFKEGFTYHMFFQVKAAGAGDGACEAPVNFLLKVVPEFVTWNGSSSQWNKDENWNRSTRAELHKGKAENGPTDDNHKTDGHPDGYKDNGELGISGTKAFVPMKFTYVTMPTDKIAPNLINLTTIPETGSDKGDEGIYTNIGTDATDNIEYDLMVRMEESCLDNEHKVSPKTNIYDCEKFYGNWAKEIYFKPRAELVNQHYLTYGKVWVEKELTTGTWTLMSTPLQNTYAGDMYVPYNNNATKHGRQETEAFIPIKMTELQDGKLILLDKYSRTKYPIYQRSWAQSGSKVYTKTTDIRKTDYNANLVGSVDETFTLWSHTYNDVMVDYSTWKGFAIRAHKSDYIKKPTSEALIRLPKEDTTYDYYQWDGTSPDDGKLTQEVTKATTGKLFTDSKPNINGLTYGVAYGSQERTAKDYAEVIVPVGEVQEVDGYLLVGNPYLCSINMAQFLEGNKDILENEFWTYEGNEVQDPLPTEIKPLQSFFVKLKQGVTVDNDTKPITFTSAMMVGNDRELKVMPKPMMIMTAANDRGKSMATVSMGEEARSIETLFDSNLDDVPMVYTVAEGQAVSINQLTDLDKPIAFGVTCAASDEPVAVTFSDIAQLTTDDVFVVDAVTGEKTLVNEGNSISVQPNDYGRYFLLAGSTGINDKTAVQKGIVVSIRNRAVTVTSGEALTLVRATLLDGTTAYQYTGGDTTTSFTLTSGVYIIHAENAAGEQQTVKVIVKSN